jgi:hypothetical protein
LSQFETQRIQLFDEKDALAAHARALKPDFD